MTTYAWPGFGVSRFELRVQSNQRVFTGPYTPTTQVLDFLGERWVGAMTLTPPRTRAEIAAREAFFDRLHGQANLFSLWHLGRGYPQGTLRDGAVGSVRNGLSVTVNVVNGLSVTVPTVYGQAALLAAVAQGASTGTIVTLPGATLKAGDLFGVAGQLVRQLVDTVADGSGYMPVEFYPRARSAWPIGSLITWYRPTANFMLKADQVPTQWVPGSAEGASFEFIEVF